MTDNFYERIENALNDIQKMQLLFRQRYGEECPADKEIEEVLKIAKSEHEVLEQYRAIGTVEECRESLKLPCAVGDKIYEIIEDDIPVYEVYIKEYEVQDISAKEVKYCGDWAPIDYENLYLCYEDAVKKLAEMRERTDND